MEDQLQIVLSNELSQIAPRPALVEESFLPVQDMRLAVALRVLRSALSEKCPLEWVDLHRSRETFLRNLESRTRGDRPEECPPQAQVTWNFRTFPKPRIVEAFYKSMEEMDAELELALSEVADLLLRDRLKEAIVRMVVRCSNEALIQREWLANGARNWPENRKFDQIKSGRRIVRLGKRASPELRQRYLAKLPPE